MYDILDAAEKAKDAIEALDKVIDTMKDDVSKIEESHLKNIVIQDIPGNLKDYSEYIKSITSIEPKSLVDDALLHIGSTIDRLTSDGTKPDTHMGHSISPHLLKKNLFISTKITLEALLKHLSEKSGGLILSSEFANWLAFLSGGMKSVQARSTITDIYDVPRQYTYSTKTDGEIILNEPFVSICGAMTLSSFKKLTNEDDITSGFLARFLLFTPKKSLAKIAALPDYQSSESIYKTKQEMLSYLLTYPETICYTLTDAARNYFESYHYQLETETKNFSAKESSIIEPFFKRWSPYILKIAMLMRFAKDKESTIIDEYDIYNAAIIVKAASASTGWLVREHITKPREDRDKDIILTYLAENNGSRTWGEISTCKRIKEGGSKKYEALLKQLVDDGKISVTNTGIRPKKLITYTLI